MAPAIQAFRAPDGISPSRVALAFLTALIAYATSRSICGEGVYHALAKGFLAREGNAPVLHR